MLPSTDLDYLRESVPGHAVLNDGGMVCVVVPSFPLGLGFDRPSADLLLRLAAGYPDVPPDMWWFNPAVRRIDGRPIPATQALEYHLGREWQRWSRHLAQGQWRPGIDSIESYLAIVRRELAAVSPQSVA